MRENHRFLVIQDVERAEPVRELEPPFAGTVFSDNGTIRPCTGCFGCWIKTPGRCVLPDPYRDMGAYLANSGELVLVSRCCFCGPGPFVQNVLDRCISYVHPYFVIKNGEMHHRQRYHHSYGLTVAFYGGATPEEQRTAQEWVQAMAVNLYGRVNEVRFVEQPPDWRDLLRTLL